MMTHEEAQNVNEAGKEKPDSEEKDVVGTEARLNADTGQPLTPGNQEMDGDHSSLHEEAEGQPEQTKEEDEEEDFSHYGKKDLLSRLKELAHDADPLKVNHKIQDIKKYFEIFLENEYRIALKKFQEEGNTEVDFKPKPDPMKDEFFQVFNEFKKRRDAYIKRLNDEKEENLKAKRAILDKMKHITENLETVRDGYNEFKRLQAEWRNIGYVPKKDLENLRKSYKFYVNKFYDNQSIYAEFKELDRKKNLESKQLLCHKLEELAFSQDFGAIKKETKRIEDEWHHIGPVPREESENILNRFNNAMADVEQQRQSLEEAIERERQKNLKAKQAIVEKIQALQNFESENPKDWVQKDEELESLINEWRSIGFVPYNMKDEVTEEFKEAVKCFNHNKNQFFKRKKKERAQHLNRKKEIIERVRELVEPEDFKTAKNEILELQKEWKNLNTAPRKESEKLWKEFRSLCDKFFDKLGNYYQEKEKEENQNLETKQELCSRIEKAAEEGVENPEEAVKQFEQEWQGIGFVPLKEKDKIRKRFDKALKQLLNKAGNNVETNPDLINFRIKIEGLKDQDKTNQLKSEERKLSKKLKENEEEIDVLEGNLQLFSKSSKDGEKMIEDYRKKIDHLKEETAMIREKLNLINS